MGGANYMGGKRNAMKTRARDTIGRKQKVFFGRQRFDMLSKGLSGPSEPSTTFSIPFGGQQGSEKIALAHARGKQNDREEITTSYLLSPVRVSPNKGSRRKRRRGLDAHTSSSDASRSAVLDDLDLSEPMFFKEIIERILATPDLAGLGTRSSESLKVEPEQFTQESSCEIPIKRKGQSGNSSEHESYKAGNARGGNALSFDEQQFRTPQRKEKKMANNHFGRYPRASSPTMSAVEDISDWDSSDKIDESFHDSEYTEFIEGDDMDTDSWIVYQGSWSSTRPEQTERRKSSCSSSPSLGSSVCARPDSRRGGVEDRSSDGIPSKIGLYARHDGGTIYGKLFDDPDPWRRIGIILGLEDADNSEQAPTEGSFDAEKQHQSPLWETETEGSEMDLDDQREITSLELSQLHEGDISDIPSRGVHQQKTTNEPEQSSLWGTPSIPSSVNRTEEQIERTEKDNEQEIQYANQDIDCTPQDKNSDEISSAPAAPEDATFIEGFMDKELIEDHNVDVLAVPELQEVNGRFIAPSIIFDDFLWEE